MVLLLFKWAYFHVKALLLVSTFILNDPVERHGGYYETIKTQTLALKHWQWILLEYTKCISSEL